MTGVMGLSSKEQVKVEGDYPVSFNIDKPNSTPVFSPASECASSRKKSGVPRAWSPRSRAGASLPMLHRLVEALDRDLAFFFGADLNSPGIIQRAAPGRCHAPRPHRRNRPPPPRYCRARAMLIRGSLLAAAPAIHIKPDAAAASNLRDACSIGVRAFSVPIESERGSISLFGRIFATQTGVHFAGKCSRSVGVFTKVGPDHYVIDT